MRRRAFVLAVVLPALGSACGGEAPARDQWLVTVATDAPVPQLGDRLLVEILDAGGEACEACSRILPVAEAERWPLSFAIVAPEGSRAWLVRARFFRASAAGETGRPEGERIIDALGVLPSAQGVTEVALELRMDCFARPADPIARLSCDPATGSLAPAPTLAHREPAELPRPGSWPLAQPVPCAGEPPPSMVCVPGGAFLLGSPLGSPLSLAARSLPEHLVVLPPYFLDVDELTVGRALAVAAEHALAEPPPPSGPSDGLLSHCTNDASAHLDDPRPANCIDWPLARQLCEVQGKRLPTEAEWEYAAGNRGDEDLYPWGTSDAVCAHAIVARGRAESAFFESTDCFDGSGSTTVGPVASGHVMDITQLGLRNMAGNVSEWTADGFDPYDGACWQGPEPLSDPACPPAAGMISVRGASWTSALFAAQVFERNALDPPGRDASIGVRCAMSP